MKFATMKSIIIKTIQQNMFLLVMLMFFLGVGFVVPAHAVSLEQKPYQDLQEHLQGELHVAAASSLRFALPDVVRVFKQAYPQVQVTVLYGSSGRLLNQMKHGAAIDVFMPADASYAQHVTQEQPLWYAQGELGLWWLKTKEQEWQGEQQKSQEGMKLLQQPNSRIAIANPKTAPYGVQAEKWLEQVMPAQWRSKVVMAESVAQVAHFVQSGAADVGILAYPLTQNATLQEKGWTYRLDSDYEPIRMVAVATSMNNTQQSPKLAQAWLTFLCTQPAQQALQQHGFQPPVAQTSVAQKSRGDVAVCGAPL